MVLAAEFKEIGDDVFAKVTRKITPAEFNKLQPWQRGSRIGDSRLVYAAGFEGSAKRLRHRSGCRMYVRATDIDALALEPVRGA